MEKSRSNNIMITAPTNDFPNILTEIGQPITLRTITRTIDSNGKITATTTADADVNAVVQEVSYKEKIFLQMGLVNIGDVMFFVAPATTITIYDQIIWNGTTFKIRKVLMPPRIDSQLLFKQVLTVQDSGSFPT